MRFTVWPNVSVTFAAGYVVTGNRSIWIVDNLGSSVPGVSSSVHGVNQARVYCILFMTASASA